MLSSQSSAVVLTYFWVCKITMPNPCAITKTTQKRLHFDSVGHACPSDQRKGRLFDLSRDILRLRGQIINSHARCHACPFIPRLSRDNYASRLDDEIIRWNNMSSSGTCTWRILTERDREEYSSANVSGTNALRRRHIFGELLGICNYQPGAILRCCLRDGVSNALTSNNSHYKQSVFLRNFTRFFVDGFRFDTRDGCEK